MGVPISNVTRRVVYTASGTGPYNFTFEILAAGDVAVYRDDTLLTLTTNYTVTINSNGTGFVTLTAAPTGATQIAIVGNRTIQRTTDFVTGGDFFANTVNDEMDQQTIFAQQNAEGLQRALQAPQTDPTTIDMTLPRAAIRAGKVLSFDANGNPSATEFIGSNRGNWAAGTLYYVRDIIKDTSTSNIWQCVTQHTSTGAQPIGTNADAAKWFLLVDAAAAGASATAAAASASAAATSATNASNSASAASTSATNAASSASAASTSASNAATSATNAASSASAAASSATSAAASFDAFDDRYLGSKASDPTVDNDGNTLLDGAMYWDTTNNILKVYDLGATTWRRTTPTSSDQANINTVSGIAANVTTVAGIASNVTTVAGISANVTSVAGNSTNINTVAGISANVTTVATNNANVTTVASNIASVNTNATNIVAIQNASTNATNAANSATAAAASAAAAAASFDAFDDIYLGAKSSNPSVDNDGNALTVGDQYFNTTANEMRVWNGSAWQAASVVGGTVNTIAVNTSATLNYGTANGVAYLNGSKELTTGSALVFDGSRLGVGASPVTPLYVKATAGGTDPTVVTGERVRIQSNDTVGRSTYLSLIAGTSAFSGVFFGDQDAADVGLIRYLHTDNSMTFNTSGSEQMRLTSTGLGIGTSSPGFQLDVRRSTNSNVANFQQTGAGLNTDIYVNNVGSANNFLISRRSNGESWLYNSGADPFVFSTSATERMRLDSSGNLGIGTSSPNGKLDVRTASDSKLIFNDGSTTGNVRLEAVNNAYSAYKPLELNGSIQLFATGGTERARITSGGDLLVGATAQQTGGNGKLSVAGGSGGAITLTNNSNATFYTAEIYNYTTATGAGAGRYVRFSMGSTPTITGSIVGDGTSTSYNTSSDYRLKNTIAPMTGALAKIAALKPCTYKWNADGSDGQGFIAHELAEVVPQCVTGEKDAVDADGNPQYQGIDTSFLVATLTAAIQEQQAIIESLKARLDAANL